MLSVLIGNKQQSKFKPKKSQMKFVVYCVYAMMTKCVLRSCNICFEFYRSERERESEYGTHKWVKHTLRKFWSKIGFDFNFNFIAFLLRIHLILSQNDNKKNHRQFPSQFDCANWKTIVWFHRFGNLSKKKTHFLWLHSDFYFTKTLSYRFFLFFVFFRYPK